MAKNNEPESNVINLIGSGTQITGDISSNGDIRIDGIISGNLTTRGKLVVGETGFLKGEIVCKSADISGKIEGKINVAELLTLKPTSVIHGDIITLRLAIEPGAMFTGNCRMNSGKAHETSSKTKEGPQEK